MHETIENIMKKWLKKHNDDGQWVGDYDGEFDLENCCLDGNFDLNDLADEVLKVVGESKRDFIIRILGEQHKNELQGKGYDFYFVLRTELDNLSPNKENKNNE